MSEIRVNRVVAADGSGAPQFPSGLSLATGMGITNSPNITGSAVTFSGISKVTNATDSTSSTTGSLIITGGLGVAKNVYIGAGLSVAGTLTYEDVTSVDSVGLITAKSGVNISGGQLQVGVAYSVGAAGVCTAAGFVGPLTGAVTGNVTGNISGGTVAGSTGTFSGDVDIADKIVHTGDTNTALRFPGADTFTVETAGTERIRVTSTGEVKINTGSGTEGIQFQASSGSNVNLRGVGTNYGELGFFIGNNEKLRITSAGRLGIGTTNPSSMFEVAGATPQIRSTDTDAANDYSVFQNSSGNSCLLYTSPSPRDRQKSRMPSSA